MSTEHTELYTHIHDHTVILHEIIVCVCLYVKTSKFIIITIIIISKIAVSNKQ